MFLPIIAVITLCSCTAYKKMSTKPKALDLIPLTQTLIKEGKVTSLMLRRFQYYTGSEPIILERQDISKGVIVGKDGSIILKNSETLDKVIIRPHTQAVCLNIYGDSTKQLKLVFGNDNSCFLTFGPSSMPGDYDGLYVLYVLNKKNNPIAGQNVVKYGKEYYIITSGLGDGIFLNSKQFKGYDHYKNEPGRKVGLY